MHRRGLALICVLVVILAGCGALGDTSTPAATTAAPSETTTQPTTVAPTPTPEVITKTVVVTKTVTVTVTPTPTPTPTPAPTPEPTPDYSTWVSVEDVEGGLQDDSGAYLLTLTLFYHGPDLEESPDAWMTESETDTLDGACTELYAAVEYGDGVVQHEIFANHSKVILQEEDNTHVPSLTYTFRWRDPQEPIWGHEVSIRNTTRYSTKVGCTKKLPNSTTSG